MEGAWMIPINGRGVVYGELWYDEEPPGDSGVDVVLYLQRKTPIADSRCTPFLSLATDLSVQEDAIMDTFGEHCSYKIRRSESRDGGSSSAPCSAASRAGSGKDVSWQIKSATLPKSVSKTGTESPGAMPADASESGSCTLWYFPVI